MNTGNRLRLSLGPVLYHWSRQTLLKFYADMASTPVDIFYLGETVCAKRRFMNPGDWLALGRELRESGKEVILSSLALIEAGSEIGSIRKLCENDEFVVEANDMAAVHLLEKAGARFVGGASLNVYNHRTLKLLAASGMFRWVMPVELSQQAFMDLNDQKPPSMQSEVFAFGRLPLAWSARCFTARARKLPKDNCQLCCRDDPDGLLLTTRDDREFLVLNGIQTQSAQTFNLISQQPVVNIDIARISPQSSHMQDIVGVFEQWRRGTIDTTRAVTELNCVMPCGPCDGYWHGRAGMEYTGANSGSGAQPDTL